MEIENGKIIQNYQIVSKLAEGGMGVIYLARHLKLERIVAVKVLHANFFYNNDVKQRFFAEANTLSKLSHPNIVSIYDFLEIDNQFYLILEYAEGISLDKYIEENIPVNREQIAENIFGQILDGFAYAHKHNIIHRDIKPSNIIIQKDLSVKILDFGIAKILDGNNNHTKTGTSMGTIIYMSPEQILGKNIDKRSDIYSIGITLYEFLTGSNPFGAFDLSQYEIQTKILNENIDYNSSNISPRFLNTIAKAVSKDPFQRYSDCDEFRNDLFSENPSPVSNKYKTQSKYAKTEFITQNHFTSKSESVSGKYIPIFVIVALCTLAFTIYLTFFYKKESVIISNSSTNSDRSILSSNGKETKSNDPITSNSSINIEERLVKKAVVNMIDAWQQKKVDMFFSYLTDDYTYQSSSGVSRTYQERKNKAYEIFAANSYISISTSNMNVTINGDNAEVKYDQVYRSTTMNESTVKKLFLRKTNNQWKVYKELSGFY